MKSLRIIMLPVCMILLTACAATPPLDRVSLEQQVKESEIAFAQTMKNRDHDAFMSFVSEEALFFSGKSVLRGKEDVATAWKPLYEEPTPPFSWRPDQVEILDSGSLALSTGPVNGPGGELIGTFTSIWRLEDDGKWRVIFDKGNKACE